MKKITTIFAAILITASVFAQAPEKMSYQAVIRNSSDALVSTTAVGMRISILQTTATGTAVYVETQMTTSNANGLVSIEIGSGTPVTGTFAGINWANGPYFIKTETDPTGGTSYTITGTSELLSVPYALHAKTAESITGTVTEPSWALTGNAGTTPDTNFIGTTDAQGLMFKTNGVQSGYIDLVTGNTSFGQSSLLNATSGQNTAIGNSALSNTTTGSSNTAVGNSALLNNTTGTDNSAFNAGSLRSNTTGNGNTAYGRTSMFNNISGNNNIAVGSASLSQNLIGNNNVAVGYFALRLNMASENIAIGANALDANTTGTPNIAIGNHALGANTTGDNNTAVGYYSLSNNTTGRDNTANGYWSLRDNTTGQNNTTMGIYSLISNTTGIFNTSIGSNTMGNNNTGSGNTALGFGAGNFATNFAGNNNTFLGRDANATVDSLINATAVGYNAQVSQSNTLILGNGANVGIGTTTPTEKLEVIGKTKTDNFQMTTGATTGYILQSDAAGNGTWVAPATSNDFYLGQDTLGGIVFYIYIGSDRNQHGLIVNKNENTTAQWQSSGTTTNATRSWDGVYNTGLMTGSPAATYVNGLTDGGFTDWYLPSIDELSILYYNRFHANKALNAGSFSLLSNSNYWSSTEKFTGFAFSFTFNDGHANNFSDKTNNYRVRAVRAF